MSANQLSSKQRSQKNILFPWESNTVLFTHIFFNHRYWEKSAFIWSMRLQTACGWPMIFCPQPWARNNSNTTCMNSSPSVFIYLCLFNHRYSGKKLHLYGQLGYNCMWLTDYSVDWFIQERWTSESLIQFQPISLFRNSCSHSNVTCHVITAVVFIYQTMFAGGGQK